jgi:hypothetical protein
MAPAGYCGRCGTPFFAGAGTFCGRCGNRLAVPPPVATGYTWPVVPAASVPAAQHKLSHSRFFILAGLALVVLVVVGTAIAVSVKPTTNYCHFSCGPDTGPRLLSTTEYQSSQFGYRVEYATPYFSIAKQTPSLVELDGKYGFLVFNAVTGSDVNSAMQVALNSLNTNVFQHRHLLSSVVPGAEIGFVPGSGQVYTAMLPPSGGVGTGQTVSIVVLGATQGNLTITALAIGVQDLSSANSLPYGFGPARGGYFDFEISNTLWPGQS